MTRKQQLAAAVALAVTSSAAFAQGWQSQTVMPAAQKTKTQAPAAAAPVPQRAPVRQSAQQAPLQAQTQFLVRTTLLTLNDANKTGNYAVLRDVASPSFRDRNTPADLALVFAEMRRARLDLSMTALLSAELDEPPSLDGDRRLRLKGFFATEPNRVVFDLTFESVNGHWLLHGISISTRPVNRSAGGQVPVVR